MCSHYQLIRDLEKFRRRFGMNVPQEIYDLWPGYEGIFLRRPAEHGAGDEAVPALEGVKGKWGLIPFFSKDGKPKSTFNARAETVASKPTFRDPWKRGQRCIIPASAVFEPDWRSGKAVATRIEHVDGELLAIAGLWNTWRSPSGERIESYTMLTLSAENHELMKNFHRPGKEKRMVAILTEATQDDWLDAPADQAGQLITAYSAERLVAQAEPR